MLKDLLSDLGLPENSADPFVASADYLLGYEDGKNDVFVSIWPVCYGISCVTAVIPYFLTYKPSKSKIANKSSDYIMGYTKSFNENSKKTHTTVSFLSSIFFLIIIFKLVLPLGGIFSDYN